MTNWCSTSIGRSLSSGRFGVLNSRGALSAQLRSRVDLDAVIQVRSQDRLLARLRLAPGGRIRWRPARGGLLLAPQMAYADPRGRLVILGGFVLAVLIGSGRLRRRSHPPG